MPGSFPECFRLIEKAGEIVSNVSKTIVDLRSKKGLTQQELADRLSVSRSLVASWETGLRKPDFASIAEMERIFDTPEGFLASSEIDENRLFDEENVIDAEIKEFAGSSVAGRNSAAQNADILKRFLMKQNPKNRELFLQRYSSRKACKEIACEFNMSESAVRVRLMRMRNKLRQYVMREEQP